MRAWRAVPGLQLSAERYDSAGNAPDYRVVLIGTMRFRFRHERLGVQRERAPHGHAAGLAADPQRGVVHHGRETNLPDVKRVPAEIRLPGPVGGGGGPAFGRASPRWLPGVAHGERRSGVGAGQSIDPGMVGDVLGLTAAESRVAVLIGMGRSVRDIARELHRSENTVRWTLKNVLSKTNSERQADLVRLLIQLPPSDRDE